MKVKLLIAIVLGFTLGWVGSNYYWAQKVDAVKAQVASTEQSVKEGAAVVGEKAGAAFNWAGEKFKALTADEAVEEPVKE